MVSKLNSVPGDPTAPSVSSQPSVPILGSCQTPRGLGSRSGRSPVPSPPPCASALPSTPHTSSLWPNSLPSFLPHYEVDVPAGRGLVPVGEASDLLVEGSQEFPACLNPRLARKTLAFSWRGREPPPSSKPAEMRMALANEPRERICLVISKPRF